MAGFTCHIQVVCMGHMALPRGSNFLYKTVADGACNKSFAGHPGAYMKHDVNTFKTTILQKC